jgi:creatinine amidohydrolase
MSRSEIELDQGATGLLSDASNPIRACNSLEGGAAMAERKKYYYHHYTWPEMRDLVKRQPVVVLPVGSVEDHGPHLPLDVDNFLIGSICEEAARRLDGEMLLLPPIPYGFEEHHMEFPGTIDIAMEHLLHFVLDVTRSVARHGFTRILLADGHGSNMPILDLVARRTVLETEALCGAFIWPSLAKDVIERLRESDKPGGMAHACELETSLYLYLDPARVQMEKARKEIGMPPSRFIWMDLMSASPVLLMDRWSRFSKSGVVGDPTLATKEKGEKVFAAVVEALVELVREFKTYARGARQDMHL